jgi:hypothetical protein
VTHRTRASGRIGHAGSDAGLDAGFVDDPDTVILDAVQAAEPSLDRSVVQAAVKQAAPSLPQRRRLAAALTQEPDVLTTGRPVGPPQIERLTRALVDSGAPRIVVPRCGDCGQPKRLARHVGAIRICATCANHRQAAAEPCAGCGTAKIDGRGRDGQPLCQRCLGFHDSDPVDEITVVISRLDPSYDRLALASIIREAIPWQGQRHRVLWDLQDHPRLLTGDGANGSPRVNALIRALVDAGVAVVAVPACPYCGQAAVLKYQRDGLRCCRRCYDHSRLTACIRCGQLRGVAGRTTDGQPVCGPCYSTDKANQAPCADCGRITIVARRGEDPPRCRRCSPAPIATCSICGKTKSCHLASTDRPRCLSCSRQIHRGHCARCDRLTAVWGRDADGRPLCQRCSARREPCSGCGHTRHVIARAPEGPLCATCYRKHPISFRPCIDCGTTERPHHHGLCPRCAYHHQLLALLSPPDSGDLPPHMAPVFRALAASEPKTGLRWLASSAARTVLADANRGDQPLTHDSLDHLPPHKAIEHLRTVLVAGGVLPARDEQLARFEHWARDASRRVANPEEQRIVRLFATWHQLRRLRERSRRAELTAGQTHHARAEVRAAIALIAWLRDTGTTLADCTQRHIDRWLAENPPRNTRVRAFLLWTRSNHHTGDVDVPDQRRARGTRTGIEDDHRWALVRRLLHDDSVSIQDRVAGLLLLLFGQPLSKVARLTRDQIVHDDTRTRIMLGAEPLDLPSPAGRARAPTRRQPTRPRRARTHRQPPLAVPRRRSGTPDHCRAPDDQTPPARHPGPRHTQHSPDGSRRRATTGRAQQAARHPHQHRHALGPTSRRIQCHLRRRDLPKDNRAGPELDEVTKGNYSRPHSGRWWPLVTVMVVDADRDGRAGPHGHPNRGFTRQLEWRYRAVPFVKS